VRPASAGAGAAAARHDLPACLSFSPALISLHSYLTCRPADLPNIFLKIPKKPFYSYRVRRCIAASTASTARTFLNVTLLTSSNVPIPTSVRSIACAIRQFEHPTESNYALETPKRWLIHLIADCCSSNPWFRTLIHSPSAPAHLARSAIAPGSAPTLGQKKVSSPHNNRRPPSLGSPSPSSHCSAHYCLR